MTRYIALLRGINVGGNNIISMPELKAAFIERGLSDVLTYINSGNIIFTSAIADEAELKALCEQTISERFSLNIPVNIISAADLEEALANAPRWWNSDKESKHNAIFVIPPATAEDIYAQVGEIKLDYERVAHHGRVIFWSAPIKTFSKTRWSRVVGTSAYGNVTIRNANTTSKLLEIVSRGAANSSRHSAVEPDSRAISA